LIATATFANVLLPFSFDAGSYLRKFCIVNSVTK
jgi:hypothetical protein